MLTTAIASIFTRMSEVPESQPAADYTAAYKVRPLTHFRPKLTSLYQKYVVFRKMPMLVGRHERVLAIDGAYIHVRLNFRESCQYISHICTLRLCPPQIRQKLFLTVGKPHPTILIVLLPVNNLPNHPHHSVLLSIVMVVINGMSLRQIMPRLPVSFSI